MSRSRRLATGALVLVLGVAALADLLASDRPLALSWNDRLYLLPGVIDHEALRGMSGDDLRSRMTRADWALWPPVPHDPRAVRSRGVIEPLAAPSSRHLLGTDDRGRDVLARLIHGTRATLIIAAGAALCALLAGVLLGVLAALARERASARGCVAMLARGADASVVGLCDAIAAVPALLVVVAVQGLVGRGGLLVIIVVIAAPRAADSARLVRGAVLAALRAPFCEAARALGARPLRVILRHALPQAVPQLAVATALTAATAVLAEAALGFLGLGVSPPGASLGDLLRQAHENALAWHLAVPAGAAVTVMAAALGALAQP